MKSGPTLKGCTSRPRLRNAAISPRVTVVLPTPLCVPAMSTAGIIDEGNILSLLNTLLTQDKDDIYDGIIPAEVFS